MKDSIERKLRELLGDAEAIGYSKATHCTQYLDERVRALRRILVDLLDLMLYTMKEDDNGKGK